ncbi:hypothetical protein GOP47_0026965, partial [Adiantum capillus-veneris]
MYERLYEDAWHFYECLPEQVQYSWKFMKYALLKYYACSKLPARGHVYFCGTASECIQSWITQVDHEMVRLAIDSDVAKAAYASQFLSYDAFMFLHMLSGEWRYNWSALKVSLLMLYWRLPKPQDSIKDSLVTTFESLQGEFGHMVWSLFEGDTWESDLYGLPLMERSPLWRGRLFEGDTW